MQKTKTWFGEWFNTRFYHVLYQHRNHEEAKTFIQNLVSFLALPKNAKILDLACGKGRHAMFLNTLGYTVTGTDLSQNSIDQANKFANETLNFLVHDMRKPFNIKVDAVFNMFTSFGYFVDDFQDIQVLKNIAQAIPKNGIAVVDYMNVKTVMENLVSSETINRNNIVFNIKRYIKNDFIIKEINVVENANEYHFQERVKILDLEKFRAYCTQVNLKIKHIFGDYTLSEFNEKHSERLILILTK